MRRESRVVLLGVIALDERHLVRSLVQEVVPLVGRVVPDGEDPYMLERVSSSSLED
jgi:hypothetical protein